MTIYYVKYPRTESICYIDDTLDTSFVDSHGVVRPLEYLESLEFLNEATVELCQFLGGEMKPSALYDNRVFYDQNEYWIDGVPRELNDALSLVLTFLDSIHADVGESPLLTNLKNAVVSATTTAELEQIYNEIAQ